MALSIREALSKATEILRSRGIETGRLDAEVLLANVLDFTRTDLYIKDELVLEDDKLNEYFSMVRRRSDREPVAYITGEKEFMSLSFKVNNNVLIPRPETEMLVEEALEIKPLRIIDVGTGSGAIAVSLAYYLPQSNVKAIDISAEALEVARENIIRHGVQERVELLQGNLLEPFDSPVYYSSFDLITANLPYIPTPDMPVLPYDVRGYEPEGALDGGTDGLSYYRVMGPMALKVLSSGGMLLLEFGYTQAAPLAALLEGLGFCDIKIIQDLAGLDRIIKAKKN